MSPLQHKFVREYLVDMNATKACVRAGYEVSSASQAGSRLLSTIEVAIAIQRAIDERAERVGVNARDVLRAWHDIATADPAELIFERVQCCRHCHGIGHAYQWRSQAEWAEAITAAAVEHEHQMRIALKNGDERLPVLMMPTADGGFDFNPKMKPIDNCPKCDGDGIRETCVKDTRLLSRKGRALFKGIKRTKDGIEILMHDQMHAWDQMARHFGMLNDKVVHIMPGAATLHTVEELEDTASVEELLAIESVILRLDAKTELLEAKPKA